MNKKNKEKGAGFWDAQNAKVLKQNDAIIKEVSQAKMKRHVKEENEPVLDEILDSFQLNYGKAVAAKSAMLILKYVKDEL